MQANEIGQLAQTQPCELKILEDQLKQAPPGVPLRLTISEHTFAACTFMTWRKDNEWNISEEDANAIMSYDREKKEKGLLSVLRRFNVVEVCFAHPADTLCVTAVHT